MGGTAYADTATATTFALTKNILAQDFGTAEEVAGIVTKAVAESASGQGPEVSRRAPCRAYTSWYRTSEQRARSFGTG